MAGGELRVFLLCRLDPSREDIRAVFRMTPYYYRTSPADRAKLEPLETLDTEISFVLAEYEKPESTGCGA